MSLIQRIAISLMFSLVMSSPVVSAGLSGPHEGPLDLSSAQWIEVEVHMVTPQAPMISTKVETIVKKRMEEVGYRIRKGQDTSPDVVIQVTCEEGESQISPSGVDPYLNHSVMNPERVIGPPCLFHYRYKDLPIPWHVVDRVIYTQGLQTVKHLITQNPDANQMSLLLGYLRASEFPLFFCAEWGQVDRLIDVFHSSDTPLSRKKMILLLLGEIQAQPAFETLAQSLQEKDLAGDAARALGEFGEKARPYLTSLLRTSQEPEVQMAAAHGLGRVGALTGDTRSTPLLLQVLSRKGVHPQVKTEVVWALGKAPDFRAFPALAELERTIWLIRSSAPELQALRQAVDWSIREVRQGGHTDDY